MKSFGINNILKVLPHKYPFLLVDRVIKLEPGKSITAIKNVTIDEPFFQGHFPDFPVMPGVLQIEAIAQTAGLMLIATFGEDKSCDYDTFLMSVSNAKFRRIVQPGDQLQIEVKVASTNRLMAKIEGCITVDGQTVTEASMMFMLSPKNDRDNYRKEG